MPTLTGSVPDLIGDADWIRRRVEIWVESTTEAGGNMGQLRHAVLDSSGGFTVANLPATAGAVYYRVCARWQPAGVGAVATTTTPWFALDADLDVEAAVPVDVGVVGSDVVPELLAAHAETVELAGQVDAKVAAIPTTNAEVVAAELQDETSPAREVLSATIAQGRTVVLRTFSIKDYGASAAATPAVNRQALRDAYAAAVAAGGGVVEVPAGETFKVEPTARVSATNVEAADGHVVPITSAVPIQWAIKGTLSFRNIGDTDPATTWQTVGGAVWRGSVFYIRTGAGAQTFTGGGKIIGGTHTTGNHAWPADPGTGDGWDLTHKGILTEVDAVYDVAVTRLTVTGFRGECIQGNGAGWGRRMSVTFSEMGDSNGNGISCSADTEIMFNHFRDCAGYAAENTYFGPMRIDHNTAESCAKGAFVALPGGAVTGPLFIRHNTATLCRDGAVGCVQGLINATVSDNLAIDCGSSVGHSTYFFATAAGKPFRDVTIARNRAEATTMSLPNAGFEYRDDGGVGVTRMTIEDNTATLTAAGATGGKTFNVGHVYAVPGAVIRRNLANGTTYGRTDQASAVEFPVTDTATHVVCRRRPDRTAAFVVHTSVRVTSAVGFLLRVRWWDASGTERYHDIVNWSTEAAGVVPRQPVYILASSANESQYVTVEVTSADGAKPVYVTASITEVP